MADFGRGLTFWLHGWTYLFGHRRLLAVAMLPMLISFFFCFLVIWLTWTHVGLWVQQLIGLILGQATGWWYDLLYYPLAVGGGILVFLATIYVAFVVHNLVAIPFYSLLADRTLVQLGKKRGDSSWRSSLRLLRVGVLKSILLLAMGVVLFVFSFVPFLNLLAVTGALMILAFDCMDYAFDGVGFSLRQRLGYLLREWAQWLGMAAGLALTLLVPGLTLLIVPGAVVGSALILKDRP
jgi:uncharacterized protein involved in cysteine biosynthesis